MAAVRDPVTGQVQRPDTTVGAVGPEDTGWRSLFAGAFVQSKNAMVLLDGQRRLVEFNGAFLRLVGYSRDALIGHQLFEFVIGGPILSDVEWRAALRRRQFTAVGDLRRQDGGRVTVEAAGHPSVVSGQRLVLVVALSTSRKGRQLATVPVDQAKAGVLSERELQIVRLIALGASGPEIAEELHVTHNTVRTHVRNSMVKLGTRSRAQLVAMLLADGMIQTDQP